MNNLMLIYLELKSVFIAFAIVNWKKKKRLVELPELIDANFQTIA